MPTQSKRTQWITLTVLLVGYFFCGKLGLKLAFVNASATAVWPATGLAIASLILLGLRAWPVITIGAFLVNITTTGFLISSLGISIGNTLEAVVGAYLVMRFAGGRNAFVRASDTFRFVFFAGGLATAISATIGVLTLALTGNAQWADFWPIWLTWWLGDASGAILVVPLVIIWTRKWPVEWSLRRIAEAALLLCGVLFVAVIIFTGFPFPRRYPLQFLFIPFLLWVSYRFSLRETVTTISAISGLALWATLHGLGPFAATGATAPNTSLLLLQGFIGVVSIATLGMAALAHERQQAQAALENARGTLEVDVREKTKELSDTLARVRKLSLELMRVRDEERRRLSRDLHDGVSQDLVGLLLALNQLAAKLPTGGWTAKTTAECLAVTQKVLISLRTLSYLLHPPLLDETGLLDATRWYANGLAERAGLAVTIDGNPDAQRLPIEIETVAFRIIQEALTNVHRHSGSLTASVRIAVNPTEVQVEVGDHGKGLPQDVVEGKRSGVGLASMRERVSEFGGRFEINSGPGGTRITASIPLNGFRLTYP